MKASRDQHRLYHHHQHQRRHQQTGLMRESPETGGCHRQQQQIGNQHEMHHQQDNLPDYCRKLTVRDSNGVLKEMIFPKALDLDRPKRARTTFSSEQLLRLEEAFRHNHYMIGKERNDLAKVLSLSETQVKVWFQNRRTKFKRDQQGGAGDPAMELGDHPHPGGGGSRAFFSGGPLSDEAVAAPKLFESPLESPDQDGAAAVPTRRYLFSGEAKSVGPMPSPGHWYSVPWYHPPPGTAGPSAGSPFLMPVVPHSQPLPQPLPLPPPTPPTQSSRQQQLESLGSFQLNAQAFCHLPYSQLPNIFKPRTI